MELGRIAQGLFNVLTFPHYKAENHQKIAKQYDSFNCVTILCYWVWPTQSQYVFFHQNTSATTSETSNAPSNVQKVCTDYSEGKPTTKKVLKASLRDITHSKYDNYKHWSKFFDNLRHINRDLIF